MIVSKCCGMKLSLRIWGTCCRHLPESFRKKSRKSSASVLGLRTQIWTWVLRNMIQKLLHLYSGFWYYFYSNIEGSSFVCLILIPAIEESSIAAGNLRCNVYPEQRHVGSRQVCENACLWYRPLWNSWVSSSCLLEKWCV